MTAVEWLGVIQQAQDCPKGMEKLIVKYGEMLIAEQERMYSEEEVKNIANWAFGFYRRNDLSEEELENEFNRILVEQFKKK